MQVLVLASGSDRVAARVERALRARGVDVVVAGGAQATQMFTVCAHDGRSTVDPVMPVFARRSAWWLDVAPASEDEMFVVGENFSAMWAIAALMPAPVLNRPGPQGWPSSWTAGRLQGYQGTGDDPPGPAEVYASSPDAVDLQPHTVVWGRSVDGRTAALAELPDQTPVRARPVGLADAYEIVTVVGSQAFTATTDARSTRLNLAARSVELAQAAGLAFATVRWAVGANDMARPVRVSSDPGMGDLRYAWPEIEAALWRELVA